MELKSGNESGGIDKRNKSIYSVFYKNRKKRESRESREAASYLTHFDNEDERVIHELQ